MLRAVFLHTPILRDIQQKKRHISLLSWCFSCKIPLKNSSVNKILTDTPIYFFKLAVYNDNIDT